MKIKISDTKNPLITHAENFMSSYLRQHRVQVAIFLVTLYSLLFFLAGILVHKTGVIEQVIKPAIKHKRVFLKHLAKGIFLARPEHITIDIKHKDFQKLEYKRREALELGKLIKEAGDDVPARIRYKDKALKVKLRLKGDHTDHLEGNKWSFRISLKGDEALFGMKVFSIQHPKTRNYIYEWLFHKMLRREGIIGLRYDFIDVTLNGRDLGIYAIEEFFDKRLIEHNGYKEGPIIRFDETAMWDELLQRGSVVNSGTYLSSPIDAFQTKKTMEDPLLRQQFIKAISLLESFRQGKLKASDVFDVEKLAAFFAITDLMGAQHAAIWINMRFYFNPITSRLEPIGFDGNSGIPIDTLCLKSDEAYTAVSQAGVLESFYSALSDDKDFFKQYIRELQKVSEPAYLENFFNEIGSGLDEKLNIIYKEFPYYNFSKDVFYHNQHIINVMLNPVKTLNAYFNKLDKDAIELELGNIQAMDLEVLGVSYKDSIIFKPLQEIILPGKIASQPVEYKNVEFFFPENFLWEDKAISDLKADCRVLGLTEARREYIFPFTHLDKNYIDNDFVRSRPNAQDFDFIIIDKGAKKIFIKPGEWDLSRNLIIPGGFTLISAGNTRINLSNKAKILSFSPLQFIGKEEEPILIYSEDFTGEGVIVMSNRERSLLKYVIFKNLSAPEEAGWGLTGAVTFYESPVDIYNCQFTGNRSGDDGLNIARSEFTIDRALFDHTFFDAFDCDFGKGKITNSSFIKCGNDAIDVSGAAVEIKNVFIDGAGDKGISAGEISNVTANQVEVKNSNIAIAAKDMSILNISNINISDCNYGFTVYQKKSEYGPARINVEFLKEKNIRRMYVVEKGSSLSVDKTNIQPNEAGAYKLLYGEK